MKKAEIGWTQIVAVILALVVIVVAIVIYTTTIRTGTKDITRCGGMGFEGECKSSCDPNTEIESATFSAGCPEGTKCCIKKENE